MNEKTDILLSRYFGGEASEQELCRLDEWLTESEENEEYFYQMTMLYQQMVEISSSTRPDVAKALANFKKHIEESQKHQKKPIIRLRYFYRIAAASVILLTGLFAFIMLNRQEKQVQMAASGTTLNYNISENVNVELASGSQIQFDGKNKSDIELAGKAKFSVHKQTEKELVVRAGNTYIKDVGTIFSVDAQAPNDSITVEVEQGEVWFYTLDNDGIFLEATEKGIYLVREKRFERVEKEPLNEIIFNANSLSEVISMLETRFGANIEVQNESLLPLQISVSFDKNESLNNILTIITETLSLTFVKDGNLFIIAQ